jgi:hypothetical protein
MFFQRKFLPDFVRITLPAPLLVIPQPATKEAGQRATEQFGRFDGSIHIGDGIWDARVPFHRHC